MTTEQYRYEFADYRNEMWLETFQVTKITPQGLWLNVYGKQKFVLNNAAKKWAYPTKELALESFKRRKNCQIQILTANLERAKAGLEAAKNFSTTDPAPLLLPFTFKL